MARKFKHKRALKKSPYFRSNEAVFNTPLSTSFKLSPSGAKRIVKPIEIPRHSQTSLPFRPYVKVVKQSAICRARKVRREVLFAKGKQGGSHKPPVFTLKSLIRC